MLIARLIDPNEFAVVRGSSFADLNTVRPDLVVVGLVATMIAAPAPTAPPASAFSWTKALAGLLLVAALVAVSTALVGPVTFFGPLVVALAVVIDRPAAAAAERVHIGRWPAGGQDT